MVAQLAEEQERGGRHDRERHPAQDLVDPVAQLRANEGEPSRLQRELRRVRVGAHRRRHHATRARGDERSGERFSARLLRDRLRFPADERLVQLEPVGDEHLAVHDDLPAAREVQHVVQHHAVHGNLEATPPSRTTCALGAVSRVSRSRVRFARSSCTIPTPVFTIRTNPNSASWNGPTTTMIASIAPRSALNRVNTLERTICATVLVCVRGTRLTCPRASRSATSAELRPRSASTMREAYP